MVDYSKPIQYKDGSPATYLGTNRDGFHRVTPKGYPDSTTANYYNEYGGHCNVYHEPIENVPDVDWDKPLITSDGRNVRLRHISMGNAAEVFIGDNKYSKSYHADGIHYTRTINETNPKIINAPIEVTDEKLANSLRNAEKLWNEAYSELVMRGYTVADEDGDELTTTHIKSISKAVICTKEI